MAFFRRAQKVLRSSKRAVCFERGDFTYLAYLASSQPEDWIPGADKLCQARQLHLFHLALSTNTNLFAGCSVFKHGCRHSNNKQILFFRIEQPCLLSFVALFDRVTSSCPPSSRPPDCQVRVGELCSSPWMAGVRAENKTKPRNKSESYPGSQAAEVKYANAC